MLEGFVNLVSELFPACGGTPAPALRVPQAALDLVYAGGALDAMPRSRIADIRRLTGAEVHDLT